MKCTITSFILCCDCIDEVENGMQYALWKKACKEPYQMLDTPNNELEYLEHNGYIITTETGDGHILIAPTDPIILQIGLGQTRFYCANHDEHLSE